MRQCNNTKKEGNWYPSMGEMLYNGICLPKDWPPKNLSGTSREPLSVPYLKNPPSVIPLNVGRQLFVDDFLIEHTTLHRLFHTPRLYEHNPILKPETSLEMNNGICPVACPFHDGVFYDPKDQLFRMWYHAGWFDGIGSGVMHCLSLPKTLHHLARLRPITSILAAPIIQRGVNSYVPD